MVINKCLHENKNKCQIQHRLRDDECNRKEFKDGFQSAQNTKKNLLHYPLFLPYGLFELAFVFNIQTRSIVKNETTIKSAQEAETTVADVPANQTMTNLPLFQQISSCKSSHKYK